MNRREFLQCAAIIISGSSASQLGFALTEEQKVYLATAPSFIDRNVQAFSGPQRKIVTAIAERIIPRTDTPGAIDAGVPIFIELMFAKWLNKQERRIFVLGLKDLQTRIPEEYGRSFDALPAEEQLTILEDLETDASDSPWYEFGNVQRQFISDAPFICQIKELTIWGFFTSEVGAKQVLRYKPMPMRFDGDIELSPDDSTWAAPMF
jgi:hypothetical protein